MSKETITLNHIAERLNVSAVTISKALRNHPDISKKTKKIIKKTAEEMGYTPNFMARNLSSKKTNTIGLIVPKIAHYFFGCIIESIYDIAFDSGYEIILMVSQESEEKEKKHIQTLLAMRVDGIIVSVSQETKDCSTFESVLKRNIPLIFIDRIPKMKNINKVFVDDKIGSYKAIEHAIKLGYKKIAHFGGYPQVNITQQRLEGFENAMNDHNIPINSEWNMNGGFDDKYGYEAFMKLYKKKNLPDLIFAVAYPVALGIYRATHELGLKIPNDIDLICFGDAEEQKYLSPPLSCIKQPTNLIAKNAMEIMLAKLGDSEEEDVKSVEVATELILRGTCISNKNKKANQL